MSHNLTQPEEIDHVLMTMADLVSSGVAQPDETSADAEGNTSNVAGELSGEVAHKKLA